MSDSGSEGRAAGDKRSASQRSMTPENDDQLAEAPASSRLTLDEILAAPDSKVPASKRTRIEAAAYAKRKLDSSSFTGSIQTMQDSAKQVQPTWKNMAPSSQQGFPNSSIYCYRNSLLQALAHDVRFVDFFRKFHHPSDCVRVGAARPCIACGLANLLHTYWNNSSPAQLSQSIYSYQRVIADNGGTSGDLAGQADPAHMWSWLMDKFSKQLPSSQYKILQSLTQPHFLGTQVCPRCKDKLVREETEGALCLDLKPRRASLLGYMASSLAFDVSGYRCEKCNHVANFRRVRHLAYSPETLVIQLKRFTQSFTGGFTKDSVNVEVPLLLDLDRFRASSNTVSSHYQLFAVVSHAGSLRGGHYISAAKGPNGQWLIFNDRMRPQPTSAAQAAKGAGHGFTPYMLFYQRQP